MIAIPALHIRDGACVQLADSTYDQEVVRIPDVLGVDHAWQRYGFHYLHVVDLDAINGRGSNTELIRTLVSRSEAEVQVGGGLKTREALQQMLAEGARRVIVGARALEEPDWIAEMSGLFPGSVVVAADVRERKVLAAGWARARPILLLDLIDELNRLPLAGLIVGTSPYDDIAGAPHLALLEDAAADAEFPVIAAGNFTTMSELRAVADRAVSAAIVGAALYSGALDPRLVAEEFAD